MAAGSCLIMHYHIMPIPEATAIYIQITTMLVLYVAANTADNGLSARTRMPHCLAARGKWLTFFNDIILLAVAVGLLISL